MLVLSRMLPTLFCASLCALRAPRSLPFLGAVLFFVVARAQHLPPSLADVSSVTVFDCVGSARTDGGKILSQPRQQQALVKGMYLAHLVSFDLGNLFVYISFHAWEHAITGKLDA